MTQQEIYNALWATFEPHTRKMTPQQMAEFDGLVDLASRKLAAQERAGHKTKQVWRARQ